MYMSEHAATQETGHTDADGCYLLLVVRLNGDCWSLCAAFYATHCQHWEQSKLAKSSYIYYLKHVKCQRMVCNPNKHNIKLSKKQKKYYFWNV